MKKWMVVSIVIALLMALSACGSTQSSGASATATTELSMEGKLLVGTMKLESTSLAVNASQAKSLLPLWETLQSLASSSTAASQEVDAVVSQIESTMSTQQISSITAMKLTQQDLAAAITDTGTSSTASSSASTSNASTAQLQAGNAGTGGGNPPTDMGGGMPASTGVSVGQTQSGTTQAVTTQFYGASSQIPATLINALVQLLQKKVG